MMDIIITNASDNPIYQQIFDQISAQIVRGALTPGVCLPPIRTVAKELRISVITVKKAWEELERHGFIRAEVGRGSFVADMSVRTLEGLRDTLINARMSKDVAYYKSLGLSLPDLTARIQKHYAASRASAARKTPKK